MELDVTLADDGRVVLGTCPGCMAWQVDYDPQDFSSYNACVRTIEGVLAEHLQECRHLQMELGEDWASLV